MEDHWALSVLRRACLSEFAGSPALQRDIARLCDIVRQLPYYEFRDSNLAALADTLPDCADMESLCAVVTEIAHVCDFDHVNIFLLRQGEAIAFDKRVCTSFPAEWLQTYYENRYQYVDPVVARALNGGNPFLFSDLSDSSPVVKNFWSAAARYGVGREGCCFVFDLKLDVRVGMSFTLLGASDFAAATFELHRRDLQVLGEIACGIFVDLSGKFPEEKAQLSIDELRFLKTLLNTTLPARALAILQDANTQDLQQSICDRLGVGTILQAIAMVTHERWFDDLPFESREVAGPCLGSLQRMHLPKSL